MESHLLQMRGLKRYHINEGKTDREVASFTDAWIETSAMLLLNAIKRSHLLQMRGLKQDIPGIQGGSRLSHLLQMRGLKLPVYFLYQRG